MFKYFNENLQDTINYSALIPLYLYKLITMYQNAPILSALLLLEKNAGLEGFEKTIGQCFAYSIQTNSFLCTFFFIHQYSDLVMHEYEKCFSSLLHDINEYSEVHASSKYKGGMKFFEEKLNLIEAGRNLFTYHQAKYFFEIVERLLYVKKDWRQEDIEISPFVTCTNPVKLLVLIKHLIIQFEKIHYNLRFYTTKFKQDVDLLVNIILDGVESVNEVANIVHDKYHNKMEVIDLITYDSMDGILTNPKIEIIVSSYWKGPYEYESFLEKSSSYIIIRDLFTQSNNKFTLKPRSNFFYRSDLITSNTKVMK